MGARNSVIHAIFVHCIYKTIQTLKYTEDFVLCLFGHDRHRAADPPGVIYPLAVHALVWPAIYCRPRQILPFRRLIMIKIILVRKYHNEFCSVQIEKKLYLLVCPIEKITKMSYFYYPGTLASWVPMQFYSVFSLGHDKDLHCRDWRDGFWSL